MDCEKTNGANGPDKASGGIALPANYPSQYTWNLDVKGGGVRLRPIRPDDDEQMLKLFNAFSLETIYQRFFSYVTMTPLRVKRLTNIDYKKQMALVAEGEENGEKVLMGVARYNTPPDCENEAEMAIVVGDPWQSRGLGTQMLYHLLRVGRAEGFAKLFGLVHYDNRAVPRLFEKLGQKHHVCDNGTEWRYEVLPPEVSPD